MENFEMLKALYGFEGSHAKTMSFNEGEYFVLYQTSSKQRNWWPVVNAEGNIGFVPSNYVVKLKVEPNFLVTFLDSCISALKRRENERINGIIETKELLQRLVEKRHLIKQSLKLREKDEQFIECTQNRDSDNVQSTKNRLQQPNSTDKEEKDLIAEDLNIQFDNCWQNFSSAKLEPNIDIVQKMQDNLPANHQITAEDSCLEDDANDTESKEVNFFVTPQDVYQIIEEIRTNTNLSFKLSCKALRVVLLNLRNIFPDTISPYLESVALHLLEKPEIPKELLRDTHDAKRLRHLFSRLADCKNDSEQRTWTLYEDEKDIVQYLEELVDILNNADDSICFNEISCDHYQNLINLEQYYEMESKWQIKRLLLKVFIAACHLDHIVVDILLTSTLPLEIVQDMKSKLSDLDDFMELAKMLTVIFSLGQIMPINHQEYLNANFVTFLFELLEKNSDSFVDVIVGLLLAFNLQFNDNTQNVVLEAVRNITSAKLFTEKILLLFNRQDDPTRVLTHTVVHTNSVLKMLGDLFSFADTAAIFYTNDNKVLIDILVRQLSDLSLDDRSRKYYLDLCRKVLRNTNYVEHSHRKEDLIKIFTKILSEKSECSADDQHLVREIVNEFPQIIEDYSIRVSDP